MTPANIDLAVFKDLCDSAGADFAGELVDTFAEEAPGLLAQLRAAHASGDATAFRRAAHSVKSNALTFGAVPLSELARELEQGGLPAGLSPLDALETALGEALRA